MSDSPLDPRGKARQIFYEALELDGVEREEFLTRACRQSPEVAKEVRGLLSALDRTRDFLEEPVVQIADESALVGTDLKDYRVLEHLATGGMGSVYLARQKSPPRDVALKVLRLPWPRTSVVRRFEWEAEVLGRLQHPGIARIYEAGAAQTAIGLVPFLAMEFIRGQEITEFVRARSLPARELILLFREVCLAVHHAHQKGVLHRDLKPSNLLVDEAGKPKVLDFGVARSLVRDDPRLTTQTLVGQLIGTLPYMSPEQVRGDSDLDVSSDIYSLGVVLYELLTERLPYDPREENLPEMTRCICEEEPIPMSRIATSVSPDLEVIVQKALRKERGLRYPSAEAFADDLHRALNDQPVRARRLTKVYLARKFVRRHTGLVGGVTLAVVALALAAVISVHERWQADAARHAAVQSAESRRTVNEILMGLIRASEPGSALDLARAREQTVEDALDRLLPTIEGGEYSREVCAPLHALAARVYQRLGRLEDAERHNQLGLELNRELYGEAHLDTAATMLMEGALHYERMRFAEALAVFERCSDVLDGVVEPEHPIQLALANDLATLYQHEGQLPEAEVLFRQALKLRQSVLSEESPDLATAYHNLGSFLLETGRLGESETLLRAGWRIRQQVFHERHPDTLSSIQAMGTLLSKQGKYQGAVDLLNPALEILEQDLGPHHHWTLVTKDLLAGLHSMLGQWRSAFELARDVAWAPPETMSVYQPIRGHSLMIIAQWHVEEGRADHGEKVLRQAYHVAIHGMPRNEELVKGVGLLLEESWAGTNGLWSEEQHSVTRQEIESGKGILPWPPLDDRIAILASSGELEHATQLLRDLLEIDGGAQTRSPRQRIELRQEYAQCLLALEELELAELEFLEAYDESVDTFGGNHPQVLSLLFDLTTCYAALGDSDQADEYRAQLVQTYGVERSGSNKLP